MNSNLLAYCKTIANWICIVDNNTKNIEIINTDSYNGLMHSYGIMFLQQLYCFESGFDTVEQSVHVKHYNDYFTISMVDNSYSHTVYFSSSELKTKFFETCKWFNNGDYYKHYITSIMY